MGRAGGSGLVLALIILGSCSPRVGPSAFPAGLLALDALLASPSPSPSALAAAFSRLYPQARSAGDWLSLAKRSPGSEAAGDPKRSLSTAEAMMKGLPGSEPVSQVAAWLFLRGGQPRKALALFGPALDPDAHPGLWSEASLAVLASGAPGAPTPDQSGFARLATTLGEPSWYIDAALLALHDGDRFAASAWLRSALREGFQPRIELLWDAGLVSEIVRLVRGSQEPGLLLHGADAAWSLGDRAQAGRWWRLALAKDPDASWKAQVGLAILMPRGEAALEAARRLVLRFPEEPEALRFAAALLARDGGLDEARALLPRLAAGESVPVRLLALELGGGGGNEERLASEAIRFAEAHPASGLAAVGAMRILLERGRYDDFLALHDEWKGSDAGGPDAWFYAMIAKVLRSDFEGARAIAAEEAASPAKENGGGPSGAFAQGLTAGFGGSDPASLAKFGAALGLAENPRERSTILKEIGRLEAALGDPGKALVAWRAAAAADPDDAEAVLLATRQR